MQKLERLVIGRFVLRGRLLNIQVNKDQVTPLHNLPLPQDTPTEQVGLLPIDILGEPERMIDRTFELAFRLSI